MKKAYQFTYEVYEQLSELSEQEQQLIQSARQKAHHAYVPYSHFGVAAVGLLTNGEVVASTNQENASYPVGICAERVLLSTISSLYPDVPLETIAISYYNPQGGDDKPISPCGMCRQALLEQQTRTNKKVRLLLTGQTGVVIKIEDALDLLPLHFSATDLHLQEEQG